MSEPSSILPQNVVFTPEEERILDEINAEMVAEAEARRTATKPNRSVRHRKNAKKKQAGDNA